MEEGWKAHSECWNVGKWAQEKRASSHPLCLGSSLTPYFAQSRLSFGVEGTCLINIGTLIPLEESRLLQLSFPHIALKAPFSHCQEPLEDQ